MSLFGMIPREEYRKSPLFSLAETLGSCYDLDTDPQWDDTLTSKTFPELLEGLVFYGVLSEFKASVALTVWFETEGSLREPRPDVLLLNVMHSI